MNDTFLGLTLGQAKAWLRERLDDGANCPCCGQRAQAYRRSISGATAATLIRAFRQHGQYAFHLPTFDSARGGDMSKLRFWGLLAEERQLREDGGRAGWWAVTVRGVRFIEGSLTVPRWVHVYDNKPLRASGPELGIRDVLGTRFDYRELMGR